MKQVAPIVRAVCCKGRRNMNIGIELPHSPRFQNLTGAPLAHRGMWYGKNPCDENSFGKVFSRPYITVGKVGTRITP